MSTTTIASHGRMPRVRPASRPEGGNAAFATTARVWLLLIGYLGLVHVYVTYVGTGMIGDPRAGLFALPMIAGFGAVGLVGVWFSPRAGFPAAWGPGATARQRLLYPALIGMAFGLVTVGIELVFQGTRLFLEQTGRASFNVPFPDSLLVYSGGTILLEVMYRLLALPLLLWLISRVALRGRAETPVFWVLAVLTSLIEPVTQTEMLFRSGPLGLAIAQAASSFGLNLAQAIMFRRYGLVAALTVRLGQYAVWHIAYGNFICQC